MLTLHILGQVYVALNDQNLNLSKKSTALLTYLALEGKAHHREYLAGLLWDTPDALANLRAELTKIKRLKLNLFASRQPMLALNCPVDLHQYTERAADPEQSNLAALLSLLRGPPLTGLADLGSLEFRTWLSQRQSKIKTQLQEVLGELYAHFERQGRGYEAELVRARAELLELNLDIKPRLNFPEIHFEWPETLGAIRDVLHLAQNKPQLILLQGHTGFRRALVQASVSGTAWQTVQVQASSNQRLLWATLLTQLTKLTGDQAPLLPTAAHTLANDDTDLIQMAETLKRAEIPVLIAVHDAALLNMWLADGLRFIMDLPLPVVVLLSTTVYRPLDELATSLGHVDWSRVHRLKMLPLGIIGVLHAAARQPSEQTLTRTQAAQLSQQSEGSPLFIRALLRSPGGPGGPASTLSMPDSVRNVFLSKLSYLPPTVVEGLSQLSQIRNRFHPQLAAALLGPPVSEVLREAVKHKVLLSASWSETVRLPELSYWPDDAEEHLVFSRELMRVALAGALPAVERHHLRLRIAELRRRPEFILLDDESFQSPGLHSTPQPWTNLPRVTALADWPQPPAQSPRCELRTANGYRVALEGGVLEVLRRGRLGPTPLLRLLLPFGTAGQWSMLARLDIFRPSAENQATPYAFSVGTETSPNWHSFTAPTSDGPLDNGRVVPIGTWFRLSGEGEQGVVELRVNAVDIALSIAEFVWAGQDLLHYY